VAKSNVPWLSMIRNDIWHDSPKGGVEKLGSVIITGEELKKGSNTKYKIQFEGEDFEPEYIFFRLNKMSASHGFIPFVESETSMKTKGSNKHTFKEIEVHSAALIEDDEERKAMIELFQW